MTAEDGRHGGSGSPEPETSREVRPSVRGWFGAAMATLTALLLMGTGNDLGLEAPGRILMGAVLAGCLSGLVWGFCAARRPAANHLSPQANMALGMAVFVLLWGTYLAASRVWTQLEVMIWVYAGGVVYGVAATVCALVLAFHEEQQRTAS